MNRKTKGALAAGAGAILLLGGAGSYALWGAEDDLDDRTITTGNFSLSCPDGTWTDISGTMLNGPVVTASDLMVPGDTWKYSAECTAKATGKNMKAVLSVDGITTGSTTPATSLVTITPEIGGATTHTFVGPNIDETITVDVIVAFSAAATNTDFANGTINVEGMKIKLDQVRP